MKYSAQKKSLLFLVSLFVLFAVSSCGKSVPTVNDLDHLTDTEGKEISALDFVKKYCVGDSSPDCAKVRQYISIKSLRGSKPQGY